LQTTRYLRLVNDTDDEVEISVKSSRDADTQKMTLKAGDDAYLTVNDERLDLRSVYVWGKADGKSWTRYKNKALILVPRPYRSRDVGTFTYRFR
jgi:GH35 family endo-1,4-beta-xylanase